MNVATGRVFDDAGWMMGDPEGGSPSLVRAVYENKRFTPRDDLDGIYRYADWMPIKRTLRKSCAPVTYKSKGLARYLGLENLYITFSGWNPRIGAKMRTCSFKETEEADPHRPVRRQYRPGLRPGVLRQPHPYRHLRPRGQPARPVVPPEAPPLREARGGSARMRLLRRHHRGREVGDRPALHAGRRREERRPARRHGHHPAELRGADGTDSRRLFPGRGLRHRRHRRLGERLPPGRRRPLRGEQAR